MFSLDKAIFCNVESKTSAIARLSTTPNAKDDELKLGITNKIPAAPLVVDIAVCVIKTVKNSINVYPNQAGFIAVLSFWVVVLYRSYCPLAAASRVRANSAATCA